MNLGLVLTGGGARAAYQVGVIQAIADFSPSKETPFNIITGVSTGAINGSYLMSHADNFKLSAQGLWDLWLNIHSDNVFRVDTMTMASLGTKWLGMLGAGGLLGKKKRINHLLDTGPLRELLTRELKLERLPEYFEKKILRGVSFSATNYQTGTSISFYDGIDDITPWVRSTRLGVRTPLSVEHVLASCAIPIFFSPIKINGSYYGDGCIKLNSPLSPAIHLGADKIIAIGIRHPKTNYEVVHLNNQPAKSKVTIAEISGTILNSVFLDSLETDIERTERINSTIALMSHKHLAKMTSKLRQIPVLALRPSQDLGELAIGTLHEFPSIIRFLLRGLGAKENKGWDLLSYLAFERTYTNQLIELGYLDTLQKKNLILEFIYGTPKETTPEQVNQLPT
jgi:NTE family protein